MDKIKSIKIKNSDGTYTDEIPIEVSIENVDYDSKKTLKEVIGDFDYEKGTVEERLNGVKEELSAHEENLSNMVQAGTGRRSLIFGNGIGSQATGRGSVTFGSNNEVTGNSSFAIGAGNKISSMQSIAIGSSNVVSGYAAYVIGAHCTANETCSFAFGSDIRVDGQHALGFGFGTIATANESVACGRYNLEDLEKKYLFIIGNGYGDQRRSNAFTMDENGNAWYAGNMDVAGGNITIGKTKFTEGQIKEILNWGNSKTLVVIYTEEGDPDSYETISFTCNYSFGDIQIAIREGRPIIGYYDYKVGNDHVTTSLDGFSYSDEIGSIKWRSTKPRITNLDYVAISKLEIVHNLNGNIEHSAEEKKVPLVSE